MMCLVWFYCFILLGSSGNHPGDVWLRVTPSSSSRSYVFFQDQDGKLKKAEIQDNRDGTYKVSYVPDRAGRYTIVIKYGGDEIPTSPYRVRASTTGDASKCTVTGRV